MSTRESATRTRSNDGVMMVAFLAGAAGLVCLACGGPDSSPGLQPDDDPGSGEVVSVAVTRLWVPRTMMELANHKTEWAVIRSRQDLQAFLSARRMTDLWFAFSTRSRQASGREIEITYIHRPYSDLLDARFFKAGLSMVAGERPSRSLEDWSNARIDAIPEDLAGHDPRETLAAIRVRLAEADERAIKAPVP
jgi:hypothetical protein